MSIPRVGASLVAQVVKNLPPMRETLVQSLGQEDPLEKGMATHSSILAWKIPWTEEPGGLQSMGLQRVGHDRVTNTDTQGELSDWTAKNTEAYCLTFGEAESLKSRNQEDHDL